VIEHNHVVVSGTEKLEVGHESHLILTRMSTNVQDELSTTVVDKYTQSFFNKRL
jgi:hypothetical protein